MLLYYSLFLYVFINGFLCGLDSAVLFLGPHCITELSAWMCEPFLPQLPRSSGRPCWIGKRTLQSRDIKRLLPSNLTSWKMLLKMLEEFQKKGLIYPVQSEDQELSPDKCCWGLHSKGGKLVNLLDIQIESNWYKLQTQFRNRSRRIVTDGLRMLLWGELVPHGQDICISCEHGAHPGPDLLLQTSSSISRIWKARQKRT